MKNLNSLGKETLIFATQNKYKLEEVNHLLNGLFNVIGLHDAGFGDDIPEDEPTLEGNARFKARYIYNKLHKNVFADDTGLEIEALNGEPGVISARYAGEGKNPEDNIRLVLKKMRGVENRQAQFRTVICLIYNHTEFVFEGVVKGSLLTEKNGISGFGYDPIFKPDGYEDTFAQMPMELKNKISHRGLAMQKLIAFLQTC
ncbi:MAG: RdgB/HAM1 family non-canonical purine NTP pyrophosphatase [Salinivirgaceae bacterium]|nr:RdgB/HAM1 family non-canonical purine NTP pyrophosphatase [Salinivirgaceae bacterium]